MKHLLLLFITLSCLACQSTPEHITVTAINEDGLRARWLTSAGNEARPAVVVFPGSSGGFIPDKHFHGLVESGYDVLSIAYHGIRGLPKRIERIPLESLHQGIQWFRQHYPSHQRKLVVLGVSRGGELALLYASNYHDIDGVVAYSPACVSLPTHVELKATEAAMASWTYQERDIPYLPLRPFDSPAGEVIYKTYIEEALQDTQALAAAMIPVEAIRCPVLLLSAEDDQAWPSTLMSELLMQRLVAQRTEALFTHLSFPDAGHQFLWFAEGEPPYAVSSQSMRITGIKKHRFIYGGTDAGTIQAMLDSRAATLQFLEQL